MHRRTRSARLLVVTLLLVLGDRFRYLLEPLSEHRNIADDMNPEIAGYLCGGAKRSTATSGFAANFYRHARHLCSLQTKIVDYGTAVQRLVSSTD